MVRLHLIRDGKFIASVKHGSRATAIREALDLQEGCPDDGMIELLDDEGIRWEWRPTIGWTVTVDPAA